MFRTISIIGFLFVALVLVVQFFTAGGAKRCGRLPGWQKLFYGAMVLAAAVLALTGLGTTVVLGHGMHGWLLMAHASLAPLFAVALVAVTLSWADRCRFNDSASVFCAYQKTLFWLMVASGLVVILSAVLPMIKLLGTGGQDWILDVHRYSSLVLAMTVIAQLGRFAAGRTGGTAR